MPPATPAPGQAPFGACRAAGARDAASRPPASGRGSGHRRPRWRHRARRRLRAARPGRHRGVLAPARRLRAAADVTGALILLAGLPWGLGLAGRPSAARALARLAAGAGVPGEPAQRRYGHHGAGRGGLAAVGGVRGRGDRRGHRRGLRPARPAAARDRPGPGPGRRPRRHRRDHRAAPAQDRGAGRPPPARGAGRYRHHRRPGPARGGRRRAGPWLTAPPGHRRPSAGHQARVHTVVAGDTLWDLARAYLGSGDRWHQIYALNRGRPQPGGGTLTDPARIYPGWDLLIPAASPPHRRGNPPGTGRPAPHHRTPAPAASGSPGPARSPHPAASTPAAGRPAARPHLGPARGTAAVRGAARAGNRRRGQRRRRAGPPPAAEPLPARPGAHLQPRTRCPAAPGHLRPGPRGPRPRHRDGLPDGTSPDDTEPGPGPGPGPGPVRA